MSDPTTTTTPATDANKGRAERLCAAINASLGWRGADPEWTRENGYTGRVRLSRRAARAIRRTITVTLAVGMILAAVGCGSSTNTSPPAEEAATTQPAETTPTETTPPTTTAKAPIEQKAEVEAAFGHKFRTQFNTGENAGFLSHLAWTCRTSGHESSGTMEYLCEGWGAEKVGSNCLAVSSEPATVNGIPALQSTTWRPGEGPFDPGSCREKATEEHGGI
jgi:hypothetical protein